MYVYQDHVDITILGYAYSFIFTPPLIGGVSACMPEASAAVARSRGATPRLFWPARHSPDSEYQALHAPNSYV
jgi:hypothetical protein